jgi:glucose-1-phosphate thymidylyltransferase
MIRKGIIVAGGKGSRLEPLTKGVSKQLLPIYDKPQIYYPLTTLILAGVRDILVIVDPQNLEAFRRLLGDGSRWGLSIKLAVQRSPKGVADALIIADEFLRGQHSVMILGDTILYGQGNGGELGLTPNDTGATVTRTCVDDPRRFGVLELGDRMKPVSIEEKPKSPKSNYVIPGLYFFDETASAKARSLAPSKRGELEITDLLLLYLAENKLETVPLEEGTTWFDIGSIDGLFEAGELVRTSQKSRNQLIGSPEIASWRQGWISDARLLSAAAEISTDYGRLVEKAILDAT